VNTQEQWIASRAIATLYDEENEITTVQESLEIAIADMAASVAMFGGVLGKVDEAAIVKYIQDRK